MKDVRESSELELESGDLIIAVTHVFVTIPKNPQPEAQIREVCFLKKKSFPNCKRVIQTKECVESKVWLESRGTIKSTLG